MLRTAEALIVVALLFELFHEARLAKNLATI